MMLNVVDETTTNSSNQISPTGSPTASNHKQPTALEQNGQPNNQQNSQTANSHPLIGKQLSNSSNNSNSNHTIYEHLNHQMETTTISNSSAAAASSNNAAEQHAEHHQLTSHLHNLHPSTHGLESHHSGHHSPAHHLHQQNSTGNGSTTSNGSASGEHHSEQLSMLDPSLVQHYSTGHHYASDPHHSPLHHAAAAVHSEEGSPLNPNNRGSAENLTNSNNSASTPNSNATSSGPSLTSSSSTTSASTSAAAFTSTVLSGTNAFIQNPFIGVTAGSNNAVISGQNTILPNTFYYRTEWPGSTNSAIASSATAGGIQHSPISGSAANSLNTVTLNTQVGEILSYPNSTSQYAVGAQQIGQASGQVNLIGNQQAQCKLIGLSFVNFVDQKFEISNNLSAAFSSILSYDFIL